MSWKALVSHRDRTPNGARGKRGMRARGKREESGRDEQVVLGPREAGRTRSNKHVKPQPNPVAGRLFGEGGGGRRGRSERRRITLEKGKRSSFS